MRRIGGGFAGRCNGPHSMLGLSSGGKCLPPGYLGQGVVPIGWRGGVSEKRLRRQGDRHVVFRREVTARIIGAGRWSSLEALDAEPQQSSVSVPRNV